MSDLKQINYFAFIGFITISYVVSSIGPQLLEETTSFHINKYIGLILGMVSLCILFLLVKNSQIAELFLLYFTIPLFILMVKTVNEHFLGNSSLTYAIAIPIVVFLISYYASKSREDRPDSEDPTFLERLPAIYLIGIAILHIYIYFILGKNYKLLN